MNDLLQTWMSRFKSENTPEGYVKSLECVVAYALYQHKPVDIDFTGLEMNKANISL